MQSGEGRTAQEWVYFPNLFRSIVRLTWSQLCASIQGSNESIITVDLFDSSAKYNRFCPSVDTAAILINTRWPYSSLGACLSHGLRTWYTQKDPLYIVHGWLHEAQTACRVRRWYILVPFCSHHWFHTPITPLVSFAERTTKQETSHILQIAFLFSWLMKSIPFKNSKAPCPFRLLINKELITKQSQELLRNLQLAYMKWTVLSFRFTYIHPLHTYCDNIYLCGMPPRWVAMTVIHGELPDC